MHLATGRLFAAQVELSSGFALAVLLVGPRAEFVVLGLVGQDVVRAVELLPLVEGHLLEHVVLVGVALLLFHEEVVGGGDLVVLVVLDKGGRLLQVLALKVVLQALDLLVDHGNAVLANDDSLHLHAPDLVVPVVVAYISYLKPLVRISLQDLLN